MSCTAALYGTLGMLNFSLVITQGMQSLPLCAAQQASGLIFACASTPAKPPTPSPPPATSLFATSTPPRLCYWLLPGLTTLQQGCILHYFPPEPSKPIATQTLLVSGAASVLAKGPALAPSAATRRTTAASTTGRKRRTGVGGILSSKHNRQDNENYGTDSGARAAT